MISISSLPALGRPALLLALALVAGWQTASAEVVRIAGASSVAVPVSAAAKILGPQVGADFEIVTSGGSDAGVESLGLHRVDMAMVVTEMSGSIRSKYPDVLFTPVFIGRQVIALAVSDDLWQAGVRSVTRVQWQQIYQKRIKNWSKVGGPNLPISFFDWAATSGTWQMFGTWLYGDSRRTPQGNFPAVDDSAGALKALRETKGAVAIVPLLALAGSNLHALSIPDLHEKMIEPTAANVATGAYPLNRPLFLVTDDRATGAEKDLITYLLGSEGQALMRANGYYPAAELKPLGDPNAK